MNQKGEDKKTALKLINKYLILLNLLRYAESYNLLEEENKALRTEINDLKINLKINKEIISGFFNLKNQSEKVNFYIKKITEENEILSKLAERTVREKDELRTKLTTAEELASEALSRQREENEINKNKIFIIENAIIKKENIINTLKKKLEKFIDYEEGRIPNCFEKEIMVVEPSIAINNLHDELILYKNCYDNLSVHYKQMKISVMKYEAIVNGLNNEITKLKTKIKMLEIDELDYGNRHATQPNKPCGYKKKRNLSQNLTKKNNKIDYNPNADLEDTLSYRNQKDKKTKYAKDKLEDTLSKEEYSKKTQEKIKEKSTQEWIEIMKIIGLTLEEFDSFLNNNSLAKLIEALELLNRLLNDKNLQIKIFEDENENLNKKNYNLNKENIFLFQQNIELKKHVEKLMENKQLANSVNNNNKISNIETNESSLLNNVSRKNNILNSLNKQNLSLNNNLSNITLIKNSTEIVHKLDKNNDNKFSSDIKLKFDNNGSEIAEIEYIKAEDNKIRHQKHNSANHSANKTSINKNDEISNKAHLNVYKDKTQKAKLKNFGDTDDFSIEIEANFEMFSNKNNHKNQSRNIRSNLHYIEESNENELNVKTANNINKRYKTPNVIPSRFNTYNDIHLENNNNNNKKIDSKNISSIKNNLGCQENNFENYLTTEKNINKPNSNVRLNNCKSTNNLNNPTNNNLIKISDYNAISSNSSNKINNLIKNANKNNIYNKASVKNLSNPIYESSICDETYNNSKVMENSEVNYRPCKTVDNMDLENSRSNNLKRNMIDDMDSIIYNNIEKLFDNNINTRQINKNTISKVNLKSNSMIKLEKNYNKYNHNQINKESAILDETESLYYESEKDIYYLNSNNNNNDLNNINYINDKKSKFEKNLLDNKNSKRLQNDKDKLHKRKELSATFEENESSQIPDSNADESNANNYEKYNYNNNDSSNEYQRNNQKYNVNNDKKFNKEEFNNLNVNYNSNLFKNHQITNSKYINTNLNKPKAKDEKTFNETNAENTIKFGMSTEFKDNLNFGESFMSSNMGDIAKMEVTIKHSNN